MSTSAILGCCCDNDAKDSSCLFSDTYTPDSYPDGVYYSTVIYRATFQVDSSELTCLGNFCKGGGDSDCQVSNGGCYSGEDFVQDCVESFGCQGSKPITEELAYGSGDASRHWLSRKICGSCSDSTGSNACPSSFAERNYYKRINYKTTITSAEISDVYEMSEETYDDWDGGAWSNPDISADPYTLDTFTHPTWCSGDGSSSVDCMGCGISDTESNPTSSNFTSVMKLKATSSLHDDWDGTKNCCVDDAPSSAGSCSRQPVLKCDNDCGNKAATCVGAGCTWSNPAISAKHIGKVNFMAVQVTDKDGSNDPDTGEEITKIEVRATRTCRTGCTGSTYKKVCYKLIFNLLDISSRHP